MTSGGGRRTTSATPRHFASTPRLLRRHLRQPARLVPNAAKKTAAPPSAREKAPRRCRSRPRCQALHAAPAVPAPPSDHQRDAREAGRPADAARRKLDTARLPREPRRENPLAEHNRHGAAGRRDQAHRRASDGRLQRRDHLARASAAATPGRRRGIRLIREASPPAATSSPPAAPDYPARPAIRATQNRGYRSLCGQLNATATCYPGTKLVCVTRSRTTQALHETISYVGTVISERCNPDGGDTDD